MNVSDALKRCFDVVVGSSALAILSPVLLAVAVLVRLQLGRPVLFRQVRPGLNARPFEIIKFRTMRDARGADGRVLPDSERLTPFGRFLRSTSLDELPELWNVIRGQMSLVGPRPLLMDYLPFYNPEQARRHEVRPGITGWAQVNGRNAISWEQKFSLDLWYVEHRGLWVDVKVLALTVLKIIKRDGINSSADETMPRFTGSGDLPESIGHAQRRPR
jgi:lipopolysaccharide/colanic/teichoic acid biosynthesis glycosyltransferase